MIGVDDVPDNPEVITEPFEDSTLLSSLPFFFLGLDVFDFRKGVNESGIRIRKQSGGTQRGR